jgi:hypothetical protein
MVLERHPKYFKLAVGAFKENVSVGWLTVHLGRIQCRQLSLLSVVWMASQECQ